MELHRKVAMIMQVKLPSSLHLLLWFLLSTQFSRGEDIMLLGSSLSPSSTPLQSSSSAFLLSFRPPPASAVANVSSSPNLYLAISFTVAQEGPPAWVANRDSYAVSSAAKLTLFSDGDLSLSDPNVYPSPIWSSQTANRGVVGAKLLDNGNLVLLNNNSEYVWQSFLLPTDTLLPTQNFNESSSLNSNERVGLFKSGNYTLSFPSTGLLQLSSSAQPAGYWADWGRITTFWFDIVQSNIVLRSSPSSIIQTLHGVVNGSSSTVRLTLDVDGNLRLYVWDTAFTEWRSIWMAFTDVCSRVNGLCGSYGVCMFNPQPTCVCPQGFTVEDPTLLSAGCRPTYAISNCSTPIKYAEIESVDFPYNDYKSVTNLSISECKEQCSATCSCVAAVFWQADDYGRCWLKQSVLNGQYKESQKHRVFLKISAKDPLVVSPIRDTPAKWSSQRTV